MDTRLYVGGLPYAMDDEGLRELFAQYGAVESAQVIMDRMTGQSRGFGFVEMGSDSEAQEAISQLNGSDVGGRTLTVNVARPRQDRGPGGGGGGGGWGGGGGGGGRGGGGGYGGGRGGGRGDYGGGGGGYGRRGGW